MGRPGGLPPFLAAYCRLRVVAGKCPKSGCGAMKLPKSMFIFGRQGRSLTCRICYVSDCGPGELCIAAPLPSFFKSLPSVYNTCCSRCWLNYFTRHCSASATVLTSLTLPSETHYKPYNFGSRHDHHGLPTQPCLRDDRPRRKNSAINDPSTGTNKTLEPHFDGPNGRHGKVHKVSVRHRRDYYAYPCSLRNARRRESTSSG